MVISVFAPWSLSKRFWRSWTLLSAWKVIMVSIPSLVSVSYMFWNTQVTNILHWLSTRQNVYLFFGFRFKLTTSLSLQDGNSLRWILRHVILGRLLGMTALHFSILFYNSLSIFILLYSSLSFFVPFYTSLLFPIPLWLSLSFVVPLYLSLSLYPSLSFSTLLRLSLSFIVLLYLSLSYNIVRLPLVDHVYPKQHFFRALCSTSLLFSLLQS